MANSAPGGGGPQDRQEVVQGGGHGQAQPAPAKPRDHRQDHRVGGDSAQHRQNRGDTHPATARGMHDQRDQSGKDQHVDDQHHQHRPDRRRAQQHDQHRHAQRKPGVADHAALAPSRPRPGQRPRARATQAHGPRPPWSLPDSPARSADRTADPDRPPRQSGTASPTARNRTRIEVEKEPRGGDPTQAIRAKKGRVLSRISVIWPPGGGRQPDPISTPTASTRPPPTTTCKTARQKGVCIQRFWIQAMAHSSTKTTMMAMVVAVQKSGIR